MTNSMSDMSIPYSIVGYYDSDNIAQAHICQAQTYHAKGYSCTYTSCFCRPLSEVGACKGPGLTSQGCVVHPNTMLIVGRLPQECVDLMGSVFSVAEYHGFGYYAQVFTT